MKKCYKCGREIADESSFCPYCMEKFVQGDKAENVQSIKKSKKPYVILGSVVVIIFVIIAIALVMGGDKGEDAKEKTKGSSATEENNDENADNNSKEDGKSNMELDLDSYTGIWYTEECIKNSTTPTQDGGCELRIYSIDEESILFSIYLYQTPPASRVAQIEYVEAKIDKAGMIEFEFEDDGWGNAGTGKLMLKEDGVNLFVKVTNENSSAMWSLNTNTNMLKSDEELTDESKDFMGIIGRDYYDVVNVMGLKETGSDYNEYGGMNHYIENGITIWEEDSKIYSVVVDYTVLNEHKKKNYCFTSSINGNSSYNDIEKAMGEVMYTDDYNGENITCFKTKETLFPTYLKVTMIGGKITSIYYYVSMT